VRQRQSINSGHARCRGPSSPNPQGFKGIVPMPPPPSTATWISPPAETIVQQMPLRWLTTMTIFYTTYEAIPLPESEDFGVCGGAYTNCWVKPQSEQGASKLASAVIQERRWKIVSIQEECRKRKRRMECDLM